jgi:hypothetical protein
MPPDPTNADRQQRWRDRQAGRLAAAVRVSCQACSKLHTGARGQLCSRCWQSLTPEGRADRAARVAKVRAKAKAKV